MPTHTCFSQSVRHVTNERTAVWVANPQSKPAKRPCRWTTSLLRFKKDENSHKCCQFPNVYSSCTLQFSAPKELQRLHVTYPSLMRLHKPWIKTSFYTKWTPVKIHGKVSSNKCETLVSLNLLFYLYLQMRYNTLDTVRRCCLPCHQTWKQRQEPRL